MGTAAAPMVSAAPTADPIVAAADLSRPGTITGSDPCHGRFPDDASDDVGTVTAIATVKRTGEVASVSIVDESPKGQGFGAAAGACLLASRFTAALDKAGQPAATSTRINLRFTR